MNPERFTGYAGPSAHRVWKAIYEENCFGLSELGLLSSSSPNPGLVSLPDSMTGALRADGTESTKECLERRVYYKVISGLHASISTHLCYEELNQTTGEWVRSHYAVTAVEASLRLRSPRIQGPNLQCFISRVAAYPERLQYIYFDAVLVLRAVARLGPYLSAYDYCATGTHDDDTETHARLSKVIDIASRVGRFDETVLFRGENANVLKAEFKEHFRNVTRIMDCVGCDRCRLWGKVQTTGIATALKVLFELDTKTLEYVHLFFSYLSLVSLILLPRYSPKSNANLLQRSEVVALINVLHRLVESLHMVQDFRRMWAETGVEEEARLIKVVESESESAPKAHHSPDANAPSRPQNFLADLLDRVACWVRACRDGTVGCFRGFIDGVTAVLEAATSVFKLSGKDQGPGRSDL